MPIDVEEDGAGARRLGRHETRHHEEEAEAVAIREERRLQLRATTKLTADLRFEDGDVHHQADEHE